SNVCSSDLGEGAIALQDPAAGRRAVDAGKVAFEERPVALLGLAPAGLHALSDGDAAENRLVGRLAFEIHGRDANLDVERRAVGPESDRFVDLGGGTRPRALRVVLLALV